MPAGTAFGQVGQAVLVPGTHRTSSFLCVAGAGAARSLYSACHGAGTIIDAFARAGKSGNGEPGQATLRFRYDGTQPQTVRHLDDRGVGEALRILTDNDLVRPVARMRPIAVLH
jgi:tRNA-splicing ligase RtcB